MVTTTGRTPFEDLTQEQQEAAFKSWITKQASKKGLAVAKRNAQNLLRERYSEDYLVIYNTEKEKLGID